MRPEDFYRPRNVRKHLRSFARNASKNRKRTALLAGAFVLLLYVTFDNRGIISRVQLETRRSEMIARIAAAEDSTARLKASIQALEKDQKTVETVAREKHGMTRQGEKLYRVQREHVRQE